MARWQRRRQPADRHRTQHRHGAAAVVCVVMADDHAIEACDASRPQVGHHDAIARIDVIRERRSGIEQQCMGLRCGPRPRGPGRRPAPSSRPRPAPGPFGMERNSGSSNPAPTQRAGNPRGSSIQSAPATASGTAHAGGACCCHTASGTAFSHSSSAMQIAIAACAHTAIQLPGSTAASSESGTTMRLTSGNGEGVGERRDQGDLLEQGEQQGYQGDRHRPLGSHPCPQPVHPTDACRHRRA